LFKNKLKQIMRELNINQAKLCDMAGIGRSSISQYLSGKVEPTENRKKEIAKALGISPLYFTEEIAKIKQDTKLKNISVEEVARVMGLDVCTVKKGLINERFPWGYAIQTSQNNWRYWINAQKFAEKEGFQPTPKEQEV
jgi:Predicted transcriptional regulators